MRDFYLSRQLTFRLRHAIQAVLTQRLLMVLVPSFSELLSFFLPFALGVELFVAFDGLSAGVGIVPSAFMCTTIFISSISWEVSLAQGARLSLKFCDNQSGHFY
jgi:hypothetical protein